MTLKQKHLAPSELCNISNKTFISLLRNGDSDSFVRAPVKGGVVVE